MKKAWIFALAALLLQPSTGEAAERDASRPWVDHYMIYYGALDKKTIELAKTYQLVVLHPTNTSLTRAQVKEIQQGKNPKDPADDVKVLGYISIGEDLRTYGLTDAQMKKDPRLAGDGTGPRVDPRGPQPDGSLSLKGISPAGSPSPGGKGFASYYLDDNDRDGSPDRNAYFDVAFVNIGDPKWFDALNAMKLDADGVAGLREILTESYGRGFGFDGVLLDTVDTAAPNSYTNETSGNQSEFEWTAPGYKSFLKKLKAAYPGKFVLQNRGLFYFDPRLAHYEFNPGKEIDFLLFESYRLDSNPNEAFNPNFALDNKFSAMPKIMAEANREDGFQVLSLGYAEGPPSKIKKETLLYQSKVGLELLKQDIAEAQNAAGFRHYITDGQLALANEFVRKEASLNDKSPPTWSSTYNDSPTWPPKSVTPRLGIREAVPGKDGVTVRWDVALDLHAVKYTLYYQEQPFDFKQDPNLTKAKRYELPLNDVGEGYGAGGAAADTYPYEAVVRGLKKGTTYYFAIRASDRSKQANEEKNEIWLSTRTLP